MALRPTFTTPKTVTKLYSCQSWPVCAECDLVIAQVADTTQTLDGSGYLLLWVKHISDSANGQRRTVIYEYDRARTSVDMRACDIEIACCADVCTAAMLRWFGAGRHVANLSINDNTVTITLADGTSFSEELPDDNHLVSASVVEGNLTLVLSDGSTITTPLPGGVADLSENSIGDLSDVNIDGIESGEILIWNGTEFVPGSQAGEGDPISEVVSNRVSSETTGAAVAAEFVGDPVLVGGGMLIVRWADTLGCERISYLRLGASTHTRSLAGTYTDISPLTIFSRTMSGAVGATTIQLVLSAFFAVPACATHARITFRASAFSSTFTNTNQSVYWRWHDAAFNLHTAAIAQSRSAGLSADEAWNTVLVPIVAGEVRLQYEYTEIGNNAYNLGVVQAYLDGFYIG